MSLCVLVEKILPGIVPNTVALVFGIFTALWGISGVLVTAFMCALPEPWFFLDTKKCIDIVKWVNYISITNIIAEVLFISIPLILWNLRTSAGKRFYVTLAILARFRYVCPFHGTSMSIFQVLTVISIVAAISVQLYYFNRYVLIFAEYWRIVLCVQIAQNLSIITACLPCLCPFIIKILGGSVQRERIRVDYLGLGKKGARVRRDGKVTYDPMSSQSSALVGSDGDEKKGPPDYCHPLATYGLDRSSAHLHSHHFNPFPLNGTLHVADPESPPPTDIFNSPVSIPAQRPAISHSRQQSSSRTLAQHPRKHSRSHTHSRTPSDVPQIPQTLSDVGVLPLIDWSDDESNDPNSGRSSQASRRPNSEYVFNRSKVISVPEESHLREGNDHHDGEYYNKYYPPLPSPKAPKKPPRNF